MFRIDLELEFTPQKIDDLLPEGDRLRPAPCYDEKIIPVSEICCRTKRMLYEPIRLIEVDIGEYLARQVSDRNAFSPRIGYAFVMRDIETIDDLVEKPKRDRIGYPESKDPFQYLMIDRIEELPHIRAPDI